MFWDCVRADWPDERTTAASCSGQKRQKREKGNNKKWSRKYKEKCMCVYIYIEREREMIERYPVNRTITKIGSRWPTQTVIRAWLRPPLSSGMGSNLWVGVNKWVQYAIRATLSSPYTTCNPCYYHYYYHYYYYYGRNHFARAPRWPDVFSWKAHRLFSVCFSLLLLFINCCVVYILCVFYCLYVVFLLGGPPLVCSAARSCSSCLLCCIC